MSGKSFVYTNSYERKINGLYLKPEKSDVNFVFDANTDHPEKVPAHKIILSLHNPVFDAMFYGSMKEKGDIPISDASAAAFKEFLQFFYLDQVRLTSENIVQVMNLCKMYEMDECMKSCETTLQKALTVDDMCTGYNIALLLERKNLIEFCEQQIIKNARGIIKSASFLECRRSLLERILTLVSSKWNTLETVIACMEWAKADCIRNDLEMKPSNFRSRLGELVDGIPFEKLSSEQFNQYLATYKGFFNGEEIGTICQKILSHTQQSKPFDLELLPVDFARSSLSTDNILECDRRGSGTFIHNWEVSSTFFTSNKKLLLMKFYISANVKGSEMIYSIYKHCSFYQSKPFKHTNQCVDLPKPIVIEADTQYVILIEKFENGNFQAPNLNSFVGLGQGVAISFHESKDLVSRLIFQIPNSEPGHIDWPPLVAYPRRWRCQQN